jgi:hypothetical protein
VKGAVWADALPHLVLFTNVTKLVDNLFKAPDRISEKTYCWVAHQLPCLVCTRPLLSSYSLKVLPDFVAPILSHDLPSELRQVNSTSEPD